MKTCKKCGTVYQAKKCPPCKKLYNQQYYMTNADKILNQKKSYYEENKDTIAASRKKYIAANRDEILANQKVYYQKNRDKFREQSKIYREENKEQIAECKKNYYRENKQQILEYNKQYRIENAAKISANRKSKYQENKSSIIEKIRRYHQNKRNTDPVFKLKHNLRNRLRKALQSEQREGSAVRDLGCTGSELKLYLESKFQPGMSWDNYGFGPDKWNIDHIIPLSAVDLTDKSAFLRVNHYSNLQPMWQGENLKKAAKVKFREVKFAFEEEE